MRCSEGFLPQIPQNLDAKGRPPFDAVAYIGAMRNAGATLQPVRGAPGNVELDGTFTIEIPADLTIRRRVAAVKESFVSRRDADPHAAGRVAESLLEEAALQRFLAAVGDDLGAAVRELARLEDAYVVAAERESETPGPDATRAADIAGEDYQAALDQVLAMPVRCQADVALKAMFGDRFCDSAEQLKKVVADIAAFTVPAPAHSLSERHSLAA